LDQAIALAEYVVMRDPVNPNGHTNLGWNYVHSGRLDEAIASFRSADFEAAFDELHEGWAEPWPSEIAQVYAWVGNTDEEFEWLDKAVEQNETGLNTVFQWQFFAPLYTNPRWLAFRDRTGTSEAQLDAIEFKVTLPE
jgi:tetratricopeptide (TPR) repeat protein